MDHREALRKIVDLTCPDHHFADVSIRCADHINQHINEDDGRVTQDWIVDLTGIEKVGPNVRSGRAVMSFNTGRTSLQVTQQASITYTTTCEVQCERFMIAGAGTPEGSADWVVNDITIGGLSQFNQQVDIPGDIFATNAIDSFMAFRVAPPDTDIVVTVTYIGVNEGGCPFNAVMIGTKVGKEMLEYRCVDPVVRAGPDYFNIPPGFACVSFETSPGRSAKITVPPLDATIMSVAIDAAIDAATVSGVPLRTPAVDAIVSQAVECSGLIHDAYVAVIMQQAGELIAAEAKSVRREGRRAPRRR